MNPLPKLHWLRPSAGLFRSLLIYYGRPDRDRRVARFYRSFIGRGNLCFDIGAHVGARVRMWTRLGARVVAVEPQPICMQLLRRWYGDSPQVTLVEAAVAAKPGTVMLHVSERTPTVSSVSEEWMQAVRKADSFSRVHWDSGVSVQATTLDQLIDLHGEPSFCKVDVEGYEYEVLRGLSHPLPALSVEYVPATREITIACIDRLAELSCYCFNWTVSEQHVWQSDRWLGPDATRRMLESLPRDADSGDLYAFRQDTRLPASSHFIEHAPSAA